MEKSIMNHVLIVNGLEHAFLREFGCTCARCLRQGRVANTSASLVSLENNGETRHHILFDVGMGVVDSLQNCSLLTNVKTQLDWLILTHWHPDHVLDLNRLCETWRRTLKRGGKEFQPIPTWCRRGTAKWLEQDHGYEWKNLLKPFISEENKPHGMILAPIQVGIEDLKITPITVSHCTANMNSENPREDLPCCASIVIQTNSKKAVLLWDIDNRNDWIVNPTSDEQKEAVKLVSEADYLFVDSNTWSVEEIDGINTGHASFATVQRYVKVLSPKGETLLVHLSGHEDGEGKRGWGWLDWKWEQEAQAIWRSQSLPSSVRVPTIGEEFSL